MEYEFVRNYIFNQAKAKVIATTKGLYPAPLKILDVNIFFKLNILFFYM
jgi:hypothetical protein